MNSAVGLPPIENGESHRYQLVTPKKPKWVYFILTSEEHRHINIAENDQH